jgi:hypothetical protein
MTRCHDQVLAHASYVIGSKRSGEAIMVDPMMDIDMYLCAARSCAE